MFEPSDNFQEFATQTPSSARFKIDTTGTDQQYATQTPSSARFKIDPTGLQQHDMESDIRIKNVVDVILQGAKAAPPPKRGGPKLEDFHAYMPTHNYIYEPTCEMWPACSVNSRVLPSSILRIKRPRGQTCGSTAIAPSSR
jgi:hypothetical protein